MWDKASNSCITPTTCAGAVQEGNCNPTDVIPGKNCADCDKRGDVTAGTNPINVGTGIKMERDTFYRAPTSQGLSIEAGFVSAGALTPLPDWVGLFGRNRISPFDRTLRALGTIDGQDRVAAIRPDGRRFEFRGVPGATQLVPDQDLDDRLERLTTSTGATAGWKLSAANGDIAELFDFKVFDSPILAVTDRHGRTQRFSYADGAGGIKYASGSAGLPFSFTAPACVPPTGWVYELTSTGASVTTPPASGRLLCVTDHWGRQLHFQYNSQGRIVKVADPAGGIYQFVYDGPSGGCEERAYDNPACAANNLTSVIFPDNRVKTYYYNEPGYINNGAACSGAVPFSPGRGHLPSHMTRLEDENGDFFATWTYDCLGRATSSQHAGGARRVLVEYDTPASGQSTVTDFRVDDSTANQARIYSFATTLGVVRNTGVSQPCDYCTGGSSAATYDANGNVSSRTDWNGHRTNYAYDLARNLETSRTEGLTSGGTPTADTRTITTAWHATFRLPVQIAEPLRITTNVYDADGSVCGARGALCSRTVQATNDANGSQGLSATPVGTPRTWTYTYNSNGSVLTVNGPRTDVSDLTTYTYYSDSDPEPGKRGNVASITNALGHVTSITAYNAHGQPVTIVDANGLTTTLAYDARLRLKTRMVGSETTSYDYDAVGQLTRVTLPDGSYLSYSYDAAHRLTGLRDNQENRIAYTLDAMGNRTQEQVFDPANQLAQTRNRVFNNLNRLFRDVGALSQTTEYAYDNQGNLTSVKDPLNHITTNAYDALNRLRQVTDPGTGVTQYAYNGLDALTQVTDPRNLVTAYTLDGLGNLTLQSSPDTGNTVNTHDAAGNLASQTDAKGQATAYAYDALNRVTLITFDDGSSQSYAYDQGANAIGRLSSITETNASSQVTSVVAYAYDLHGRITTETRTVGGVQYVTGYSYDSAGRLSGITYPSGRSLTYDFDSVGRIYRITTTKDASSQVLVQAVAYHPFGAVKSFILGNGQQYTRSVDLDGRIASYTLGSKTFGVGYDAASRIEFISELGNPPNTNTYTYDDLDRLTGASIPGTPYAYTYDAVGNRTSRTVGSATETLAYSSTSNRIASLTPASGPVRSFILDSNGSTTNDGVNTYAYDARGRMKQATSALGTTDYQVNALGQRIRKTNTQGDTVFHYDKGGRLITETDALGVVKREYIYLGDIPVAVVAN